MSTVPDNNQAFEVREKLAQLEAQLIEGTSGIATLLRDIHRTLKADPDVVTILSDEECSILVRGLKKQTSTEIATVATKSKGKAISKMTIGDL